MDDIARSLQKLTEYLQSENLRIATAESCTGGLIAGYLTELSGSSAWFERGFVTYSNLAKEEMLGVSPAEISQFGAVSEEVARAMAIGALNFSTADVSLSVTGIAGPTGGSAVKPVGTVCFAWAIRGGRVQSEQCYFAEANRHEIRRLACLQAIEGMHTLLVDSLSGFGQ